MEVIIATDVTTYNQIEGFGEIISSFNLVVNIAQLADFTNRDKFILAIQVVANGNTYNYSNIYTEESIQPNGDIVIGEITIIGPLDFEAMIIRAKIVYLESPTY